MADQISDPLDTAPTACRGGVALPGGSGNKRTEQYAKWVLPQFGYGPAEPVEQIVEQVAHVPTTTPLRSVADCRSVEQCGGVLARLTNDPVAKGPDGDSRHARKLQESSRRCRERQAAATKERAYEELRGEVAITDATEASTHADRVKVAITVRKICRVIAAISAKGPQSQRHAGSGPRFTSYTRVGHPEVVSDNEAGRGEGTGVGCETTVPGEPHSGGWSAPTADQIPDPLDTAPTACRSGVALPGGSGNKRTEQYARWDLPQFGYGPAEPVEQIVELIAEQVVDVRAPKTAEEVVHAPVAQLVQEIPDHKLRQMVQEVPQAVHEPVEPIVEQAVHVAKITPQRCVSHQAPPSAYLGRGSQEPDDQEFPAHQTWQVAQVEPQIVHEPVELIVEQVVHVPKTILQRCVSHRTVEQTVDVLMPVMVEEVVHAPGSHQEQEIPDHQTRQMV